MAIYPNVHGTSAGIVESREEAAVMMRAGPEQDRLIAEARVLFELWAPGMIWDGYHADVAFPYEPMDGYLACTIRFVSHTTGRSIVFDNVMFTLAGELVQAEICFQ